LNVVAASYPWQFRARFRRNAFGWRSQPAIQRVKEAVSEIKSVARRDPVLGAEGGVLFLERLSPALEQVDGSSGAIGTAVYNAIRQLVPIIADAPADEKTRQRWLERLFEAHEADQMPYIESLAEYWGELCASKALASAWADLLLDASQMAMSPDPSLHGYFHGTSACLSALSRAERYREIVDIVPDTAIWHYRQWVVKALAAMGKKAEAIRYAEAARGPWTPDDAVDVLCEEILLSSGLVEEAYRRYALRANSRGTYLATFRAVSKKYPHKSPTELLDDLVETTPGHEGKWFAAAKSAGLYEEALQLAARSPCDPKTLTRAARDSLSSRTRWSFQIGLLALHWLVEGFGYEITSADVRGAYEIVLRAGAELDDLEAARAEVKRVVAAERPGGFVTSVLGPDLDRIPG
jgi:hypothetical protein